MNVCQCPFENIVTSNFDILNCAVSLNVTEDLVYQAICSEQVKLLNARRQLQLTPRAFKGAFGGIHSTMVRVAKYLDRDYHW